jgi:hypothetical protein
MRRKKAFILRGLSFSFFVVSLPLFTHLSVDFRASVPLFCLKNDVREFVEMYDF